jgi:hypothetical protein
MSIEKSIDRVNAFISIAGLLILTGLCGYAMERMGSVVALFASGIASQRYHWSVGARLAIPTTIAAAAGIFAGAIWLSERLLPAKWVRIVVLTVAMIVTVFCAALGLIQL